MADKMSLNEQAKEILRIAQEHGVEQNFFFITTFKRYQVQINILNELEKKINEDEVKAFSISWLNISNLQYIKEQLLYYLSNT